MPLVLINSNPFLLSHIFWGIGGWGASPHFLVYGGVGILGYGDGGAIDGRDEIISSTSEGRGEGV